METAISRKHRARRAAAGRRACQSLHGLSRTQEASARRCEQATFCARSWPAARKLLRNLQHATRILPGAQDARHIMRFEIQAMHIHYGVPLFATFSHDEAHQLVYVRVARVRETGPVLRCRQPGMAASRRMRGSVETLRRQFPTWDQRRAVLARDRGFRTLVQLTLHLFRSLSPLHRMRANATLSGRLWQQPRAAAASLVESDIRNAKVYQTRSMRTVRASCNVCISALRWTKSLASRPHARKSFASTTSRRGANAERTSWCKTYVAKLQAWDTDTQEFNPLTNARAHFPGQLGCEKTQPRCVRVCSRRTRWREPDAKTVWHPCADRI